MKPHTSPCYRPTPARARSHPRSPWPPSRNATCCRVPVAKGGDITVWTRSSSWDWRFAHLRPRRKHGCGKDSLTWPVHWRLAGQLALGAWDLNCNGSGQHHQPLRFSFLNGNEITARADMFPLLFSTSSPNVLPSEVPTN